MNYKFNSNMFIKYNIKKIYYKNWIQYGKIRERWNLVKRLIILLLFSIGEKRMFNYLLESESLIFLVSNHIKKKISEIFCLFFIFLGIDFEELLDLVVLRPKLLKVFLVGQFI
jgi:hypothetical protein